MTGKHFTDDEIDAIGSHILRTSTALDDIIKELGTVAENSNTPLRTMLLALDTRIKLVMLKNGIFAQTADLFFDEAAFTSEGENQ